MDPINNAAAPTDLDRRDGSAPSIQEEFGAWLRAEWRVWKKANPGFIPRYTLHLFFEDRQEDWLAYITPRAHEWHRQRGLLLIIDGRTWSFEMPDLPELP
jgi:hypothetical protein